LIANWLHVSQFHKTTNLGFVQKGLTSHYNSP
jgi:hypothetical protein